jgi:hypothetical protein
MFAVVDWPQMKPGIVVPLLAGSEPPGQTFATEGKPGSAVEVSAKPFAPL